ncbi:MAG: ribosome silencing factor [Pseudomonadota bacterium]
MKQTSNMKKKNKACLKKELWEMCASTLSEKKVADLVVLDMRELNAFADIFVIASGQSTRQACSLGEHMIYCLREEGIRPLGVEGLKSGRWVLVDYGDTVVHIFHEPIREFYDLEGLWSDAKRVALTAL